MSTFTSRAGLTLWAPTDNVQGEEAWNVNTRQLEAVMALRSDVQEPFHLKTATYDSTNNRLVLTIGPGMADFLGTLITKATDTVYYITAPALNTTYHLFIKSNGAFTHRTAAAEQGGEVRIWTVATGAALTTITTTDVRGRLAGAAARKVADDLAAHVGNVDPHPQYATDTDLTAHTGSTANPHATTAAQVGAIASVEGVTNPGGNIDLSGGGAITITPDNGAPKRITIGETHSPRTDNPHNTTAAQTGALVSLEGVSMPGGNIDLIGTGITITPDNTAKTITFALAAGAGGLASVEGVTNPGGNVDLVGGGAITISGDNTAKTVTITESHSLRADNPHGTTATQVGALASIEGVSNAGGNIDLVPGGAITISGNDAANTITISETHSARVDNPHSTNATQVGALVSVDGVSNAGGNIDLVPGANITISPNDAANTITIEVSGTVPNASNAANATNAGFASNAGNADTVDGVHAAGFVTKGGNQTVEKVNSFVLPTDTRTWTPTAWDGTFTDLPTHIDIKDGPTLVAYIDIAYNGNGDVVTYSCTAAGTTNTWNHTYSGTRWTGVS